VSLRYDINVCICLKGKFVSDGSRHVRACPDDIVLVLVVPVFLLASDGLFGIYLRKSKVLGYYRVVILGKPCNIQKIN